MNELSFGLSSARYETGPHLAQRARNGSQARASEFSSRHCVSLVSLAARCLALMLGRPLGRRASPSFAPFNEPCRRLLLAERAAVAISHSVLL